MKNQKGFAEVAVLYRVIAVLCLLFIPNPLSKAAGIGVKQNTVVQKVNHTEDIVPVMVNGEQVGFKKVVQESENVSDQAPKSWFDNLMALPRLWLGLMILGIFCPAVGGFMAMLNGKIKTAAQVAYDDLTGETKTIVVSVKAALETIKDPMAKQTVLDTLSKYQDSSTKDLVKELLKS